MSLLVAARRRHPWDEIGAIRALGLSAGASAPEVIVDEIIDAFRARFDVTVETRGHGDRDGGFPGHAGAARCRADAADMAFVNGAR